jgi:hypothetical protein
MKLAARISPSARRWVRSSHSAITSGVPQSDFPNAQFRAPGALGPYGYEEYLPGSGIWIWHGDLIPEPYTRADRSCLLRQRLRVVEDARAGCL